MFQSGGLIFVASVFKLKLNEEVVYLEKLEVWNDSLIYLLWDFWYDYIYGQSEACQPILVNVAILYPLKIPEINFFQALSWGRYNMGILTALHEKCPNKEVFLVRIFLYSEKPQYLDTFHAMQNIA